MKKTEQQLPIWYQLAKKEIGVKEIAGKKHNKRVLEYHQATTLKATTDEVAWCSSFVCWVLEACGIRSTRSAAARSYSSYGDSVSKAKIQIGDIVVFQRGNSSWQGHVGFFAGWANKDKTSIAVLGGNQSNSVNISNYPTYKLIAIRRPKA